MCLIGSPELEVMAAARLADRPGLGFSEAMYLDVTTLKNRFYGFRHGESRANVEGIIVRVIRSLVRRSTACRMRAAVRWGRVPRA